MIGLSSLLFRISALPERMEEALSRAALEAAENAQREAQSAAPVRTGALRASISAAAEPSGGAKASAGAPYAASIELGSGRRPPRPFLLPAAQASDYTARAIRAIREGLH